MTAAVIAAMTIGAATAQESAVFSLTGPITAHNNCSLSLANGGLIDLGDIEIDTIPQSSDKRFPSILLTASISCTTPTRVAFQVSDNRMDTPHPFINTNVFGLGVARNGNAIGTYVLNTSITATLDGVASATNYRSAVHNGEAGGWHVAEFGGDYWLKANGTAPQWRAIGPAGMASAPALTTGSFDIEVEVSISSRDKLDFTGTEIIDGSATIELVYL